MKTVPVRYILAYLMQPEDTSSGTAPAWLPPGGQRATRLLLEMSKTVFWTAIALVLAFGISQLSDTHPLY